MKKSIVLMMVACLLMTGLLMACSPNATPTPQPTAVVAIPLVSGGTEATQPAAPKSYTLDELKAMTDDQVRAFLNEKLMGHHTIDWLLKKNLTADEWKTALGSPEHFDFDVTDNERDFLVDWIIKNH
jgi:hypothetical protein